MLKQELLSQQNLMAKNRSQKLLFKLKLKKFQQVKINYKFANQINIIQWQNQ